MALVLLIQLMIREGLEGAIANHENKSELS